MNSYSFFRDRSHGTGNEEQVAKHEEEGTGQAANFTTFTKNTTVLTREGH